MPRRLNTSISTRGEAYRRFSIVGVELAPPPQLNYCRFPSRLAHQQGYPIRHRIRRLQICSLGYLLKSFFEGRYSSMDRVEAALRQSVEMASRLDRHSGNADPKTDRTGDRSGDHERK